jgi:hypothetical protein
LAKQSSWMIEKVGIDFPERRYCKRAQGRLPGCLRFEASGSSVECVILDISVTGAKIKLDDGIDEEIGRSLGAGRLIIAEMVDLPVERVWSEGSFCGLRFLSDPSAVAVALDELLRVQTRRK